jgi:hypothetical protein
MNVVSQEYFHLERWKYLAIGVYVRDYPPAALGMVSATRSLDYARDGSFGTSRFLRYGRNDNMGWMPPLRSGRQCGMDASTARSLHYG